MHPRSVLGVAAVNGKIYAIGGSTASGFAPGVPATAVYASSDVGGFVGTNDEYDPVSNTWTSKKPMPAPRYVFAIAAYQGKIYCIGGRTSSGYTGTNEVYDLATDTWQTKTPMPTAEGWLTANAVNGKIYVMDQSGTNYVYDPAANSWTTKAPVPAAAFGGYASAVLDKNIYVIGGYSNGSQLNMIYNTEADTWSYGAPPPSSHGGGAAGATTGEMAPKRIYVLGEIANLRQGEEPTFVRVYDPYTDSWTFGADPPTSRYNFGVAVLNDTLYAIGGHTYTWPGYYAPVAVNEQYTPVGYGTPDPSYVPPTDATTPEIAVMSPENKTYVVSNVSLTFTVSKPSAWMGYSLDGETNVTITGNTTLTGLPNGLHNLTVYATDTAGNTGASETVYFNVAQQSEPLPITWVVTGVVIIAAVGAVPVVYFAKIKSTKKVNQESQKTGTFTQRLVSPD
jgi:N-acetylneuraminic acid mutarotase